jgi:hypothetical protein
MLVIAVSLGTCSVAAAQALTLAEVKAKGGVELSASDLKQLMPDAKVVNRLPTGSTRHWTNKAEGTFVASTDGRSLSGGRNIPASGPGSWRLADNGTYCVKIDWGMLKEDWCSYIFKAGDKYYGVRRLDDSAPAGEFEFSK